MDSTQFNANILSLSDKLFRLAKSMLRNTEAAQDAVQDLSMKLWEKRKSCPRRYITITYPHHSAKNKIGISGGTG